MNDDVIDAVKPATRRGWPKGKPRAKAMPDAVKAAADRAVERAASPKPTMLTKMKAQPNWESDDFVGVGQDQVSRLLVAPEKLALLHREGVALQWGTRSVRGMDTPQELSKMTRGGWTPVYQSDFEHLLDGDFMPKGQDDIITVDDCMLMARPTAIHAKAKQHEKRLANERLNIIDAQMGQGIPNVTGSTGPGVRNVIKKTVEQIEIPE
jgi:hypothetical protein